MEQGTEEEAESPVRGDWDSLKEAYVFRLTSVNDGPILGAVKYSAYLRGEIT